MATRNRGKRPPGRSSFRSNKKKRQRVLTEMPECAYCGSRENLTVDHIRPLIKGGTNAFWNLQTLCDECNVAKGDKYPYSPPIKR